MTSINDKYSKLNYQTLSNQQIIREHKEITSGLSKLSKIEIRNRLNMLNDISKSRGFMLPEVDMGETSINEKNFKNPVSLLPSSSERKVNINYGKVVFGLISLGVGLAIFNSGLRLRYLLIIIGITLIIRGTTDRDY